MNRDILTKLISARSGRKAVALITEIESGLQRLIGIDAIVGDALHDTLRNGFRFDKSGVHSSACGEVFVQIYNPALRLVIVGAVHIAQQLAPMAKAAGYDVSVIDPRGAFATAERFGDVGLYAEWPDEILPGLNFDQRTAFVALTHDPKIDDPALALALKSDCFYIGALGSRKTQAARRERLVGTGVGDDDLARICGPIGLNLGGRGAPEIAISIMAQMTQYLRQGG